MQSIYLSIALVTRNRPEQLERCLKSWHSQTELPCEIVISDDSDDFYAPIIRDLAQQFSCIYTRGPQQGLYANRNHASLACRGTHILSADDDHTHPRDFVERILKVISVDPNRVWIFSERTPDNPQAPLICPAELGSSGAPRMPKDPLNCSAIADGSSVYPRRIFDQGLRYDETYAFGWIWYLWGKTLTRHGWKISFSPETFVWHHVEVDRSNDSKWLKKQLECNTYVMLVQAWWIEPSLLNNLRAAYYLFRRAIFSDTITGYSVTTKVGIANAVKLVSRAYGARHRYTSY